MKITMILLAVIFAISANAIVIENALENGPVTDCAAAMDEIHFHQSRVDGCITDYRPECNSYRSALHQAQANWENGCASASVTATPSTAPDTPKPTCECLSYGTLEANVISFGDFVGSSDSEGQIWAGGDVDLKLGFSVGEKIPATAVNTVVAGGSITFESGIARNGNIIYGANATIGSSVRQSMFEGVITQSNNVIDWAHLENYYKDLSTYVCSFPVSGQFIRSHAHMYVRRSNRVPEVFETTCAELDSIKSFDFAGIKEGTTLIVNVRGDDNCTLDVHAKVAASTSHLWNFCDATTLNFGNIDFQGSVLAPLAAISGKAGMINGQMVGRSFSGSTQFNYKPCGACLNDVAELDRPVHPIYHEPTFQAQF